MAIINVTPLTDITALIISDNVSEGDVLLLEEGIYFQTVAVTKNYIRIVAKGPGVIFDGKSILLDAFILVDTAGVMIEGINIRHYRASGILIEFGRGNRIVNNKINNMIEHGVEVMSSRENLIWKNEIINCYDGVLLIEGSTNNWVIENECRGCYGDGYEAFLSPDSNNAFISNKAIGNMIKETKLGTYVIFDGYFNHFVGENNIVCNRREGIENNGQYNVLFNNEISYNRDTGILLGTTSIQNLVMDNKLVCNIPGNIDDRGMDNYLINNVEKPCEPCESPSDVCGNCSDERLMKFDESDFQNVKI